ncbi:hypothetical protein XELAEV_18023964mg [Xenopus laevis]|uniref:Netrin-1 n=1 Tax=Xenopus laevis TaxID=8355 RepID=A0A974D533_XENLA|nr:hypothetical protein XELAEV_18023964mg [Xenopus laevis]
MIAGLSVQRKKESQVSKSERNAAEEDADGGLKMTATRTERGWKMLMACTSKELNEKAGGIGIVKERVLRSAQEKGRQEEGRVGIWIRLEKVEEREDLCKFAGKRGRIYVGMEQGPGFGEISPAASKNSAKLYPLRCEGHSCNPPIVNLASGRTPLTLSTCGKNITELFCSFLEQPLFEQVPPSCGQPQCTKCSVNQLKNSHPPSYMTDDVFLKPATWWQSAQGIQREEIRLDFGTVVYLTHVIMVFKSPRPAAMVLERSHNNGKDWRTYKYFATNCTATFGLQDDLTAEGSLCTSSRIRPNPSAQPNRIRICKLGTGREIACLFVTKQGSKKGSHPYFAYANQDLDSVIFRALNPANRIEDPYSPQAQDLLKITNLRLLLLKRQECPCLVVPENREKPNWFAYYAIYDLIVRGSCFCNGHAEYCQQVTHTHGTETVQNVPVHLMEVVPSLVTARHIVVRSAIQRAAGGREKILLCRQMKVPQTEAHVSVIPCPEGGCSDFFVPFLLYFTSSRHKTTKAEYVEYTKRVHWAHAESFQMGVADPIKKNKCNVHGKCVCQHNTAGDHCERCAPLYNDQPWRPGDGKTGAPNECKRCRCHNHALSCHLDFRVWLSSGRRSGGVCENCQHHTEGNHCQRCKPGYYRDHNEPMASPAACKECSCHPTGSALLTPNGSWKCHPKTGFCYCKPGVAGPYCDVCSKGFWGFSERGCRPCDCANHCDPHTGKCPDSHEHLLDIPIGGRIYDVLEAPANESEGEWKWNGEQGFSAMRYPEKCICKEQTFGPITEFCKMKFAYVIKARILSAHDKGTHAEVVVKVRKVLKSGKVSITRSNMNIYPESWTNRGCTCPVLNPGMDYLIAGSEDRRSNKLLVNMNSLVKPWKANWAKKAMDIIQSGCKQASKA